MEPNELKEALHDMISQYNADLNLQSKTFYYTEKEVEYLCKRAIMDRQLETGDECWLFDDWFEEHKKK